MIAAMSNLDTASPTLRSAEIDRLRDWVIAAGLRGAGPAELLETTAEALSGAGVQVQRAFMGFRTLHPLYSGYGFVWRRRGLAIEEEAFRRAQEPLPEYLDSPIYYILKNDLASFRIRLDRPGEVDFPLFAQFRAEGATEYFARTFAFPAPGQEPEQATQGVIFTWTTDRPGGFLGAEIGAMERILPLLALALRSISSQQIAESLLCTYIGQDAGRRVLSGEIDRGALQRRRAVILFEDLRGFTREADAAAPEDMVQALNAYLDAMGRPLLTRGGEILKFMGDGVLAVIGLDDDEAAGCRAALDAARETLAAVRGLNRVRQSEGRPAMEVDIVLHVGELMYGNVGAVGRLDFTMIGPVVNEAARMEPMCRSLGRNVIASRAFFDVCAKDGRRELASLGPHALRDIAGERELFTLKDAA
jgi:adenylate cyclase